MTHDSVCGIKISLLQLLNMAEAIFATRVKPRVFFGQLMTFRLSPEPLAKKLCSFHEWRHGRRWKTEEIQTCTTCIMHHQAHEFHKILERTTVTALTCKDIHTGADSNLPQNAHTHTPNTMMIELRQRRDLPSPPEVIIVRITLLRVSLQYKH